VLLLLSLIGYVLPVWLRIAQKNYQDLYRKKLLTNNFEEPLKSSQKSKTRVENVVNQSQKFSTWQVFAFDPNVSVTVIIEMVTL
jgi:hypothetical protein